MKHRAQPSPASPPPVGSDQLPAGGSGPLKPAKRAVSPRRPQRKNAFPQLSFFGSGRKPPTKKDGTHWLPALLPNCTLG